MRLSLQFGLTIVWAATTELAYEQEQTSQNRQASHQAQGRIALPDPYALKGLGADWVIEPNGAVADPIKSHLFRVIEPRQPS